MDQVRARRSTELGRRSLPMRPLSVAPIEKQRRPCGRRLSTQATILDFLCTRRTVWINFCPRPAHAHARARARHQATQRAGLVGCALIGPGLGPLAGCAQMGTASLRGAHPGGLADRTAARFELRRQRGQAFALRGRRPLCEASMSPLDRTQPSGVQALERLQPLLRGRMN